MYLIACIGLSRDMTRYRRAAGSPTVTVEITCAHADLSQHLYKSRFTTTDFFERRLIECNSIYKPQKYDNTTSNAHNFVNWISIEVFILQPTRFTTLGISRTRYVNCVISLNPRSMSWGFTIKQVVTYIHRCLLSSLFDCA